MAENRQWQTRQDGLDKVFLSSSAVPTPGDGEVLVRIKAVSLNYRDTEVTMGLYSHHRSVDSGAGHAPLVPCSDMCGTVVSASPSSSSAQWRAGDRVISTFCQAHLTGQIREHHMATGVGLPLDGVLQDYRVFPATALVAAPAHLSDEQACCLPIAALTAWMALEGPRGHGSHEGEVVLVQGTGGVSMSGLQIAKASGATTIVTSSSDDKLARARALGADHAINYRTHPDWAAEVMRITDNHGADIIFEVGGAKTLRRSFDCVAWGGVINSIGYVTGKTDDPADDLTNINVLALRRTVRLRGIINGPRDRFEEMCAFYAKHQIEPLVDRVFDFAQAKEALQFLFAGSHFGKVVIKVAA